VVATWEHRFRVPLVYHVGRLPREVREVETSMAAGEQALQTRLKFVRERAGTLEAHAAEQGLFTRLWPIGWAAMKRSCAPRGSGELGAAVTRADGMVLPREAQLRARDDFSRFGQFAVPRPCSRTPGAPGSFPLDAPVNFPERCDSSFWQAWLTWFAVEPPVQDSAGWFEPRLDLEGAESVVMAVAKEASQASERF
jgi:hypothetical protein